MLEHALANLEFIAKNFEDLSGEELKEKLRDIEKELRESVLILKKLKLEVLDNITNI